MGACELLCARDGWGPLAVVRLRNPPSAAGASERLFTSCGALPVLFIVARIGLAGPARAPQGRPQLPTPCSSCGAFSPTSPCPFRRFQPLRPRIRPLRAEKLLPSTTATAPSPQGPGRAKWAIRDSSLLKCGARSPVLVVESALQESTCSFRGCKCYGIVILVKASNFPATSSKGGG
ncbi:hypothetical protein VTG60DRAFT_1867 [Thermothelomyces hinnuleus]